MNFKVGFLSVLFISFLSIGTHAQEETRIGGFLAYGSEIENIGIGANAEFPIIENLTIAPSLIYYFPKEQYGIKMSWFEINANVNYYLLSQENLGVYGMGGLNFSSVKVTYDFDDVWGFGDNSSSTDSRIGLNLGAGANLTINAGLIPFAEMKYVIIDGGQFVAAAGVRFKL